MTTSAKTSELTLSKAGGELYRVELSQATLVGVNNANNLI
jgi:hypothetical protein